MNWYEQPTSEYKEPMALQILKEHGASGYGAFIILKQIISENMNDDISEWGFVPKTETMASLAEKCGLPEAQFRLFISFCDDRFFLKKVDGRLFCPSLLEQKNRYAKIVERRSRTRKDDAHSAHTVTHNPQKDVTIQSQHSTAHTQHNTNTNTDLITAELPSAEVSLGVFALKPSKGSTVSHEFQDAALRMAQSLGISKPSSSWFGFFKKNYGLHRGLIDSVYASMADLEAVEDPEKYFYKVYSIKKEAG